MSSTSTRSTPSKRKIDNITSSSIVENDTKGDAMEMGKGGSTEMSNIGGGKKPEKKQEKQAHDNQKGSEESISEIDTVIQNLFSCLDDMVDRPDPLLGMKACSTLLKLKLTQRDILDSLQETNQEIESKQASEERMETMVDNLGYEQEHLEQQIFHYRSFDVQNLIRMSAEELFTKEENEEFEKIHQQQQKRLQRQALSSSHQTKQQKQKQKQEEEHDIIKKFLKADINEPNQHSKIIARLHQEITWRGTLERDVNLKEKELQLLKQKLHLKSQFLKGLPDKLREMERASSPIQKFFHTQKKLSFDTNSTTTDATITTTATDKNTISNNINDKYKSVVHLIGSDRNTRLDMARELSGPLYTLFVQIQSYIDHQNSGILLDVSSNSIKNRKNKKKATTTDSNNFFQPEEKVVLVHIPIPDIPGVIKTSTLNKNKSSSSSSSKFVTIQFMYMPKLTAITATTMTTTGTSSSTITADGFIDHYTLLPYLFPHDDGNWTHFMDFARAKFDNPSEEEHQQFPSSKNSHRNHKQTVIGKPYLWCNYIAGLHIHTGKHPKEGLQKSTMVVIRELIRRVRANTTLTYLIKTLSQLPNPIPIHPKMKQYFENNIDNTSNEMIVPNIEKPYAFSTNNQNTCRLVKFKRRIDDDDDDDDDDGGDSSRTKCIFSVNFKRTEDCGSTTTYTNTANNMDGKNTLRTKVCIDLYRYPAIPPIWTLTCNDESWGEEHGTVTTLQTCTNPLHDEYLYQLQQKVNVDSIDELVVKDAEETYDWILAHQIREIMKQWG